MTTYACLAAYSSTPAGTRRVLVVFQWLPNEMANGSNAASRIAALPFKANGGPEGSIARVVPPLQQAAHQQGKSSLTRPTRGVSKVRVDPGPRSRPRSTRRQTMTSAARCMSVHECAAADRAPRLPRFPFASPLTILEVNSCEGR